jgi:membrane-associated protease RseP (regulator of RpoE activity)
MTNHTSNEGARVRSSFLGVAIFAAIITTIVVFSPHFGVYLGIVVALVALHEAAHLAAALRFGLACSEYSVGFGPRVLTVNVAGLDVSLRAIPAGGFVKIVGATAESEVPEGIPAERTLAGTSRRARVLTIAAGPVSNLVAAFVLSIIAFAAIGPVGADGSRAPMALRPAAQAALSDVSSTATLTVSGLGSIIGDADGYTSAVISGDRDDAPAAFMSPIGATSLIGQLDDPHLLLRFAAIISAGLGVINFLPLPPLDGGHLAVEAVNAIRSRFARRKVVTSTKVLNYASVATLSLFIVLTITAARFDLAAL